MGSSEIKYKVVSVVQEISAVDITDGIYRLVYAWNPNIYPYGYPSVGASLTTEELSSHRLIYTGEYSCEEDTALVSTSCTHEWVITHGFTSVYEDCSKCNMKKESVVEAS